MEQQAFGRVHRMGQKKETYFARMMMKNTVDERLAVLQSQKLKMIEKTIKDHDSSKLTLTLEEIASLLGRLVRDDAGNIIDIEPDYDDETDQDVEEVNWSDAADGSASDWDASAAHENQVEESGVGDAEDFTF